MFGSIPRYPSHRVFVVAEQEVARQHGSAHLRHERWLPEPFWAGPRTYAYEWVVLENERKRGAWLDPKPPPRGGEGLLDRFRTWLGER